MGKTRIKAELAAVADIDINGLPFNQELITYLKSQQQAGRNIILCTGAWHTLAQKVHEKFPFFSEYYATTRNVNLTGKNKAALLLDKFGEKNFSYVGNESKDKKIWQWANNAIVVSGSRKLVSQVEALCTIEKVIVPSQPSLFVILKSIRVHQWVKNILIFVPLAAAHQLTNLPLLLNSFLAFLSFSFCASATYLINDLADLESDRQHQKKSKRPLASGVLSIKSGLLLCALLFCLSFSICAILPIYYTFCLCLYVAITVAYSYKLKRLQTIDITILASLYTLRILVGGAAIEIEPSFWLLSFSMFVFFCLAIVKRVSEIIRNIEKHEPTTKITGRGYYASDLHVLISLGASAGMLSVLVIAMYINSPAVTVLYQQPFFLWFICPIFGYWIVRILIMASRGEVDEDPIVFAINDWRSWLAGVLICVIVIIASIYN